MRITLALIAALSVSLAAAAAHAELIHNATAIDAIEGDTATPTGWTTDIDGAGSITADTPSAGLIQFFANNATGDTRLFNAAAGLGAQWTTETVFRIDANPSDAGLFQVINRSGATVEIFIENTQIGIGTAPGGTALHSGLDLLASGAFHTLRVGLDKAGNAHVWFDGAEAIYTPTVVAGSVAIFGDSNSNIDDGTTVVDYARYNLEYIRPGGLVHNSLTVGPAEGRVVPTGYVEQDNGSGFDLDQLSTIDGNSTVYRVAGEDTGGSDNRLATATTTTATDLGSNWTAEMRFGISIEPDLGKVATQLAVRSGRLVELFVRHDAADSYGIYGGIPNTDGTGGTALITGLDLADGLMHVLRVLLDDMGNGTDGDDVVRLWIDGDEVSHAWLPDATALAHVFFGDSRGLGAVGGVHEIDYVRLNTGVVPVIPAPAALPAGRAMLLALASRRRSRR